MTATGAASPRTRTIIRLAMLSGILALYGAAWWLRREGRMPEAPASSLRILETVLVAATAFGAAAILFLKVRLPSMPADREPAVAMAMLGIGEAVALLGGVTFLQGGAPRALAFGLLTFLVALAASRPGRAR